MDTTGRRARRLMWILWPAFLAAGIATTVFFTVFDPFDLHFFGAPLDVSREVMYTMGFFGFWALAITSSALTLFLEGSLGESGGAPGEGGRARPVACPMPDNAQCAAEKERPPPP
jgi:hypothetical protein